MDTSVGYAGGSLAHPTYQDVCSGQSGHIEVVRIDYDPVRLTFERLLDVFWTLHDPTVARQRQYRSAILVQGGAQAAAATLAIHKLSAYRRFPRPIVTVIEPVGVYYRAEEYHQQYLAKRHAKFV